MRTWALWHGGASYASPYVDDDTEVFASLAEARRAFVARWDGSHQHEYPVVGDDTTMRLYFADPRGMFDPYPDRVLSIGPHGGIVTELG